MEIAAIIALVIGAVTIFSSALYFIVRLYQIEKPTLKKMDLEIEESKKQTLEMKYANDLSRYELGILKFKPIPPEHLQNQK